MQQEGFSWPLTSTWRCLYFGWFCLPRDDLGGSDRAAARGSSESLIAMIVVGIALLVIAMLLWAGPRLVWTIS